MWGWIGWTIVVLTVWVVVAVFLGLLVGRVVRRRDRQVPTSAPEAFPAPRRPFQEPPVPETRHRT